MPKQNRINQIAELLCEQRKQAEGGVGWASTTIGMTRGQIARAIGLKKSPHLVGLLQELIAGGWVYTHRLNDALGTYIYVATADLCAEYEAVQS